MMGFNICNIECDHRRYGIRSGCGSFDNANKCYEFRLRNEWAICRRAKKVLRKIGRFFIIY